MNFYLNESKIKNVQKSMRRHVSVASVKIIPDVACQHEIICSSNNKQYEVNCYLISV